MAALLVAEQGAGEIEVAGRDRVVESGGEAALVGEPPSGRRLTSGGPVGVGSAR
ncbi:hypothetical protein [Streptomyces sp. W16]|uniref:hypothetical protein n=1 Tax=Streptomyces sp. W16 TaxID=3076631 RepID=UPI00295A99E2|nr:hypothetical protein [Streptomyces sp. W16]